MIMITELSHLFQRVSVSIKQSPHTSYILLKLLASGTHTLAFYCLRVTRIIQNDLLMTDFFIQRHLYYNMLQNPIPFVSES